MFAWLLSVDAFWLLLSRLMRRKAQDDAAHHIYTDLRRHRWRSWSSSMRSARIPASWALRCCRCRSALRAATGRSKRGTHCQYSRRQVYTLGRWQILTQLQILPLLS